MSLRLIRTRLPSLPPLEHTPPEDSARPIYVAIPVTDQEMETVWVMVMDRHQRRHTDEQKYVAAPDRRECPGTAREDVVRAVLEV